MIFRLMAAVAIVAIALLAQPLMAVGQNLQLPSRFYGTAQWDCYPVPEGTVIEAMVEGDTYTTSTSEEMYRNSGYDYAIMIVPPEGTSYGEGTPVYFKIGDRDAIQVGTWEAGGNVRLDLTDECVRETRTVTYVSGVSDLVALSYDGISYGPLQNAQVAKNPGAKYWASIEGAEWISSAYQIEDGSRASWRKFEKEFTVPTYATGISASLRIAADHRYRATLNGIEIGSGSNMGHVDTWEVRPIAGVNSLTVTVVNDGFWISKYGRTAGPTGLIYALTVSYDALPVPTPSPTPFASPESTATPTPAPTLAPAPIPTVAPTVASARQYVQGYGQSDAQGGGTNMSKVVGVAFFGMVDILLMGVFVYLIWRFFVHPRAQT